MKYILDANQIKHLLYDMRYEDTELLMLDVMEEDEEIDFYAIDKNGDKLAFIFTLLSNNKIMEHQ